ncbi:hypothetical protein ACFE04_017808 [Oxalis oulophora]
MGSLCCCFKVKDDSENSTSPLRHESSSDEPDHHHVNNSRNPPAPTPTIEPQNDAENPLAPDPSPTIEPKIDGNNAAGNDKCCEDKSVAVSAKTKALLVKLQAQHGYTVQSSSNVEECLICLYEYENDHPKTLLQSCSHGFHLNCTYSWMERSPLCPICGVVMIFE